MKRRLNIPLEGALRMFRGMRTKEGKDVKGKRIVYFLSRGIPVANWKEANSVLTINIGVII
jgi:hypothetical protein